MRHLGRAVAVWLACAGAALAQAPGPAGAPPGPVSPEVLSDGRVTFRLAAPDARAVSLAGDWPIGAGQAMLRDQEGVWSVTIGPLQPDFYGYWFLVDGARTLDPRNVLTARDGVRFASQLRVPGAASADYETNDVPHGTLAQVWYPSPTLGARRRMYVYTPPGYEAGRERYPVLYLLHGGGGDEDAWTTLGRAPQILDNLIAQGRAKPMIVVMTNGNAAQAASRDLLPPPDPRGAAPPPAGASALTAAILRFPESLVQDVVPFVDATYRTRADREGRAIAGLSMGGAQALYAGFNNLDQFAWIAAFSGGFPLLPGVAVSITPPANAASLRGPDVSRSIDPVKFSELHPKLDASANPRLRLFYLSMGLEDGLITTHAALKKLLDEKGVRYTLLEKPGYGHEWRFWRLSLKDLCSRLFQAPLPAGTPR
ncbi:MAG TPA: alpha/beta hydrolase-fold protein [Vicinamibacteria bacterium]|nr:alpha/beta hydrolase-fold protein [Vicinamibacteria bacterium]